MFRNREIQQLLLIMVSITFITITVAYLFPVSTVWLVLVTATLLIICVLLFTRWRYQEIEKLSGYLRKINSGDYTLDVRDNHEGELSILKSDIYKVTLMLSEQSELLKRDKIHWSEAMSDNSNQLKTPMTSMTMMVALIISATS